MNAAFITVMHFLIITINYHRAFYFPEDKPVLQFITPQYEQTQHNQTYKTYVHILDPISNIPLTKGSTGQDCHHRGIFVGWSQVITDSETYDFWHMKNVSQRHISLISGLTDANNPILTQVLGWYTYRNTKILEETREIILIKNLPSQQIIDWNSTFKCLQKQIQFTGDPHHGGIHIRLANEVFWHPHLTYFLTPKNVQFITKSIISDAWWVCCSSVIKGKRYWLTMICSPQNSPHPPIFSLRKYGRLGIFYEFSLNQGETKTLSVRLIITTQNLSIQDCEKFYNLFLQELSLNQQN